MIVLDFNYFQSDKELFSISGITYSQCLLDLSWTVILGEEKATKRRMGKKELKTLMGRLPRCPLLGKASVLPRPSGGVGHELCQNDYSARSPIRYAFLLEINLQKRSL